jgi:putative copper resistance protein D
MQFFLGSLHGLDYLVVHFLIGSLIFCRFIAPAGGNESLELLQPFEFKFVALSLASLFTSAAWMLLSSHEMVDSWALPDLWTAMTETSFGHIWCFRIVALLALAVSLKSFLKNQTRLLLLCFLASLLPLFSSLNSHAANQETHATLGIIINFSHSLGAAFWTGGLYALYYWLGVRLAKLEKNPSLFTHQSFAVVKRFSHFAMASTAMIALSGAYLVYSAKVPMFHPWATPYGFLVTVKVFFFAVALLAAATNQFRHLKSWQVESELSFLRNIRREVRLEIIIILIIFLIAGFLTRTALPE